MATPLPPLTGAPVSASIFLVLRRMRMPLILLIVILSVSVLGLSLVPGEDAAGEPDRLSIFESFYFMSYTATTIGFGEIPQAFTPEQRLWVTFSIYLTVIGWAYAIGSLLGLLQDQGFRRALAARRVLRKIARLREPFLLVVGYGDAGERLAGPFDALGRRVVVMDVDEDRVASVHLAAYRTDVPALLGDARDAERLILAGLGHRTCEAVLALTGDDDANLAVVMSAALLRPDLRVIARAFSPSIERRMRAFGDPVVVNPLDRIGDHLRILLRSPASFQLMMWLTSAAGSDLPERRTPLTAGRWVVCGAGDFAHEIIDDLRAEGLEVDVVDPARALGAGAAEVGVDPAILIGAVGFVAATESDTDNLSLIEEAREVDGSLFTVSRQNSAANASLYAALAVDFMLVPADVLAHETLARTANPLLMSFLERVPGQGDVWSAELVARLVERCGPGTPRLWHVRLDEEQAPTLSAWLGAGTARLGDLLRSPTGREGPLDAVALLLVRADEPILAPTDDVVLAAGDQLLLAGSASARRALEATLHDEVTREYVLHGRVVPSSWVWRRLRSPRRS